MQVIHMTISGEKSEYESMVRAYSAELYRYAYWLCRDRFTAEDVVQEVFARAWQNWQSLREPSAARSWLYSILRNEHARLYEKKRFNIDEDADLNEIVDPTHSELDEQLEMRGALKMLPETYREPLLLQVLGGFSCAEIGKILDTSEGAVMARLTRARLALRKHFSIQKRHKVG